MEEGGASLSSPSLADEEQMTLEKDTPTESNAYEGKGKEKKSGKSRGETYNSFLLSLSLPQDEHEIGMRILETYNQKRKITPQKLRELTRFHYTYKKILRCNAKSASKLTDGVCAIPGLFAKISVHFTELKTFVILSETSKKIRASAISAGREHEGTLKFTPNLVTLLRLCDKEKGAEKNVNISLEKGLEKDIKFKMSEDGRSNLGIPWTEWQRAAIARHYITIFSRFPMCEFYIRMERGEISTHICHRNTVFALIHFLLRSTIKNKACMVDPRATTRRGPTFCLGSFNDPYLGPLPDTRIKTLEVVFPVRSKPTRRKKRKNRNDTTDNEPQNDDNNPAGVLQPPQAQPQDGTLLQQETPKSYENEENCTKIAMMKILLAKTENIIFSTWTSAPLVYLALKEVPKNTHTFLEMHCHL
jgi:hypothetical protein